MAFLVTNVWTSHVEAPLTSPFRVSFEIFDYSIAARAIQAKLRQGPREGDLQRDLGPGRQRRRQHRLHREEQQHFGIRLG